MKLYTTRKQRLLRHLTLPPAFFFLLTFASCVILAERFNGLASQSKSNQELKLEPKSDYERTSVGSGGLQTEHDVTRFASLYSDQKDSINPAHAPY